MSEVEASSLERADDLGKSPEAVAKRWKLELKLADKREAAWRKKAADTYRLYTPETAATNSFNVLWTNTETLRQAVYNSLPQPDARRRYQDEDPLGKAVGEVLTRSLEFAQDTYDFDGAMKGDVLSMLLAGRAVSRIKYVPDIRTVGGETAEQDGSDEEAQESEAYEEIEWEQVICERVQYDDFRILCAAKTWDEVSAVAFRHRFTREDCVEKFGEEIGNAIPLDSADDEDVKKAKDVEDLFKTAEIWEIWDKDEKEVLFVCPTHPTPAKVQDDPLRLQGFFPIPRPLYAIENDQSLVPATLYSQYEQQAKELNRTSTRINKLIDALKVRGIYDATLSELGELMKATDNELIPAQNVTALIERGGLEKAIWMIPIQEAAMVLKELQAQREACKGVIYEITGISDIMRAATNPNETFGAQKIKSQWGTQRLQRMQKEVQRYIRDLIRLKAEVIAEKFQPETLESMTLIQLPHKAEVDQQFAMQQQQYQMAMMQWQQMQGQQQPGQQPQQPPQPPQYPNNVITWEKVVEAMRNDATRTYRIDIETDSTLAATQESDMEGMTKLLGGLSQMIAQFGPAVQAGIIPMDAVKALMGAVIRRARMGTTVEDALEKIKQPPPAPNPAAIKAQQDAQQQQMQMQHEMQLQQMKDQSQEQLEQAKMQLQDQQHQRQIQADLQAKQTEAQYAMQLEQHKQEMQAQQIAHQNELEAAREAQRQQLEAAAKERESVLQAQNEANRIEMERYKIEMAYRQAIEVAEISAGVTLQTVQANAAMQASKGQEVANESQQANAKLDAVIASLSKPKKIIRGPDGKVAGVE